MHRPAILTLLLLLLCAMLVSRGGGGAHAQSSDWALAQCQQDATCRGRFFLPDPSAASSSAYTSTLFAFLYTQFASAAGIPADFNTTDPLALQLWLAAVRQATFCAPNELYVVGHGCVCPHGRLCAQSGGADQDFLFDFSSLTCLVVVFGVLLLCSWHWTVHKRFAELKDLSISLAGEVRAPTMFMVAASVPPPSPPVATASSMHIVGDLLGQ